MDDFLQKLLALRSKVGGVAKGTLENMGNGRERSQEMLDAKRDANRELIEKNFGNVENYQKFQEEQPPLPNTPGQSLGDFFARILNARNKTGQN